jgi:hypothetical protein
MPQLVKGGKYIFGWSKVRRDGRINIPPEAFHEYAFYDGENVIVIPGSLKSGGFGLAHIEEMAQSPIGSFLEKCPQLLRCELPEGETVGIGGRLYCWVKVHDKSIRLPLGTLSKYGVSNDNLLLVGRGSSMALGFIAKGLIFEEGKKHLELKVF